MKIVLAHKYFFRGGGTATYLFALREQLHAMGHETIPFTVAFERTAVDEYSEFYVAPPAGAEQDHFKDMKMTPWLALKLFARSTWSVEAYYKARALVEATKPDVAYVHNLYTYMSPSPIAAFKDAGLPVVMRVSDYNMICPGLKLLRNGGPCYECVSNGLGPALRYRCHKDSLAATAARVLGMWLHDVLGVYDLVDLFVTPSRFMADLLIEAGFDASRITHIPSFYPPSNGKRASAGLIQHILYAGRLSPVKGLETLIRAYGLMEAPPALVIAGADTNGYQSHLEDLVRQSGISGVQFVGFQGPESLADLIDGSMFMVVPSEWPDNCPMCILEAFAHGKPVIAARVGGIPEQVSEDCGLLFDAGDARALASTMVRLARDPSLCTRLGRGGYTRLNSVYSPAHHCDSLLRALEAVR